MYRVTLFTQYIRRAVAMLERKEYVNQYYIEMNIENITMTSKLVFKGVNSARSHIVFMHVVDWIVCRGFLCSMIR